jgi:hypothetical protein
MPVLVASKTIAKISKHATAFVHAHPRGIIIPSCPVEMHCIRSCREKEELEGTFLASDHLTFQESSHLHQLGSQEHVESLRAKAAAVRRPGLRRREGGDHRSSSTPRLTSGKSDLSEERSTLCEARIPHHNFSMAQNEKNFNGSKWPNRFSSPLFPFGNKDG